MKTYQALIVGLAIGFTLGLLACATPPAYIFQRIGMASRCSRR